MLVVRSRFHKLSRLSLRSVSLCAALGTEDRGRKLYKYTYLHILAEVKTVVEEGKEEEEEEEEKKRRRKEEKKKRKEEKEEEEKKRRREKKEEERKTTSMRLDPDLVRKAHDLGLNVTKVCENALKDAIRRMEGAGCEKRD